MKKLAIILAMLMIPSFAFALDTISDSDLNDVTGQAGVSILINSVTIVKTAQTTGYGDSDAVGVADGAWVNIVQQNTNTTKIGFHGAEPLMIDIINVVTVASAAGLNQAHLGTVGVMIRLPDMIEIQSNGQRDAIYLNEEAGSSTSGELIQRFNGGGTTQIIGDLVASGNANSLLTGDLEQTTIIITNH